MGIYYLVTRIPSNGKEEMYVLKRIDKEGERILAIGDETDGICCFKSIAEARKKYDIICNVFIGLQQVEASFEEVEASYKEFSEFMLPEEVSFSLHRMYESHEHDFVLSKTLIKNSMYRI